MGNANGNANERFYQIYNVPTVNYCNTCNMKELIESTIAVSGAYIVLNIQVRRSLGVRLIL